MELFVLYGSKIDPRIAAALDGLNNGGFRDLVINTDIGISRERPDVPEPSAIFRGMKCVREFGREAVLKMIRDVQNGRLT